MVYRCLGLNLTANNIRSTLLLDPEIVCMFTITTTLHYTCHTSRYPLLMMGCYTSVTWCAVLMWSSISTLWLTVIEGWTLYMLMSYPPECLCYKVCMCVCVSVCCYNYRMYMHVQCIQTLQCVHVYHRAGTKVKFYPPKLLARIPPKLWTFVEHVMLVINY